MRRHQHQFTKWEWRKGKNTEMSARKMMTTAKALLVSMKLTIIISLIKETSGRAKRRNQRGSPKNLLILWLDLVAGMMSSLKILKCC